MFKNKKILIILISIFLALVIGVSTVLIVAVSASSDNTGNSNQSENDNINTVQEFSIDVNGINFLSGTTNNIDLIVGQEYDFNINGVNSYEEYEYKVVPFLPSSSFEFLIRSDEYFYKDGVEVWQDGSSREWLTSISYISDCTEGFLFLPSSNKLTFKMQYDNLDSFFDNFFNLDVEILDFGGNNQDGNAVENFLSIHVFKLNIRKISTDEIISFVLYFKE